MIFPSWQVPENIKAMTFCRPDNISQHSLEALRLIPSNIAWLDQIHSNVATGITSNLFPDYSTISADASYTSEPGISCVIRTADCLPILLASLDGQWISAIHAGWRGLASGIIENTIAHSPNPGNLVAWLGPAISKKHFEVGKEVLDIFTRINKQDNIAFIRSNKDTDKYHADLFLLAQLRLNRLGVSKVYNSNHCTYSNPELFYSYRRDHGTADRLISCIWKTT